MIDLSWRLATKADRSLLQGFTCTEPAPRQKNKRPLPHPSPWELDVQKWFRGGDAIADAHIDSVHDGRLLLCFAGGDLVACASHARLKNPSIETPLRRMLEFDGPIRSLKAIAISVTYRKKGGELADRVMEYSLEDMMERESYASTIVISRIDRRNLASEYFAQRNQFELLDDLPEPDQLRNWFTVLEADEDGAQF
ncbi:hypothetical protein ACFC60_22200 [Kitasatospora purpeofusca]|uniref:hypothetical protein n=1 Tax=Kitasatospora purpeofusca TaxID=67352 RepID=UPI0035DE3F6E